MKGKKWKGCCRGRRTTGTGDGNVTSMMDDGRWEAEMTGGQFGRLGRRCKTLACPGGRDLNCSGQSPVLRCSNCDLALKLSSGGTMVADSIVLHQLSLSPNRSSPPGQSARLLIGGSCRHSAKRTESILPAASVLNSGSRQSRSRCRAASISGPCSSLAHAATSQGYWSSGSLWTSSHSHGKEKDKRDKRFV